MKSKLQRNSLIFHSVFLTFAYYKKVGQQKEKSLVILLLLLTSLCMVTNSLPRMGVGVWLSRPVPHNRTGQNGLNEIRNWVWVFFAITRKGFFRKIQQLQMLSNHFFLPSQKQNYHKDTIKILYSICREIYTMELIMPLSLSPPNPLKCVYLTHCYYWHSVRISERTIFLPCQK